MAVSKKTTRKDRKRTNTHQKVTGKHFPFLKLPGEIRNHIYKYTLQQSDKQCLLVHRPRLASLRPRTRSDRTRPLLKTDRQDPLTEHASKDFSERHEDRPFAGLTQTCRQIRAEYRPWYLVKQEIGFNVVDSIKYASAYYDTKLLTPEQRALERKPFFGNLTLVVANGVSAVEKEGFDILPLLHLWVTSDQMEASFGRYTYPFYYPQIDGEAKDLYRLFGARVTPNQLIAPLNKHWRQALNEEHLEAVVIHRRPGATIAQVKPYIHILYKSAHREAWMTSEDCKPVPEIWSRTFGFLNMEHFDIKVGMVGPISNVWRR